jgi:hypothetical protein
LQPARGRLTAARMVREGLATMCGTRRKCAADQKRPAKVAALGGEG